MSHLNWSVSYVKLLLCDTIDIEMDIIKIIDFLFLYMCTVEVIKWCE